MVVMRAELMVDMLVETKGLLEKMLVALMGWLMVEMLDYEMAEMLVD